MGNVPLVGVTAIDTRVAAVTVSGTEPVMLPKVALTVAEPCPVEVARPAEPDTLLTVATAFDEEAQVTCEVRFCVDPSLYVPVAVNCWSVPSATLALGGVMAIDTRVAAVTVSGASPKTLPCVAMTLVEPCAVAVARPFDPETLLTAATDGVDAVQATSVVMFCVVPSLYMPVAVYCRVVPLASVAVLGVTAIDTNVAAVVVSCEEPERPLRAAVMVAAPTPFAVARPFCPCALLTLAATPFELLQSTELVIFWVVFSL